MFKVNNKDIRTTNIRSGAFIVNFKHIINYFTPFSSVSYVDFEQVNVVNVNRL